MKVLTPDNTELMEIVAIEQNGDFLSIKGKIFGSMPMTARISPEEARRGLKLLTPRLVLFLIGFPFRRSRPK